MNIMENRINGYLFELADKDFIGIWFLGIYSYVYGVS